MTTEQIQASRLSEEIVKRPLDETTCDDCGAPLYVGDTVFYDLARGTAYCCPTCARNDDWDQLEE